MCAKKNKNIQTFRVIMPILKQSRPFTVSAGISQRKKGFFVRIIFFSLKKIRSIIACQEVLWCKRAAPFKPPNPNHYPQSHLPINL
ncbi:hypothetical protein TDB9533_04100 [Thalassocella blandensis]|nr:hypothetical protein TDB9533_04100 [Thalassocella blandensis]